MKMSRTVGVSSKKVLLLSIGLVSIYIFLKLFSWHAQLTSSSVLFDDIGNYRNKPKQAISRKGLTFSGKQFLLNDKPITIISGAVHYFRLPRQYWRDRLMKMKACGVNTLETYVPWNLHEPIPGKFDFTGDLNLIEYLSLAAELKLNVLLRPGPYICSEWEFGGMPSWLLRDPNMRVRTLYANYINAAVNYFKILIPMVTPFQYSLGGPVIAFQLDNEYGAYFKDESYLPYLKTLLENLGVVELLYVSDGITGLETQTLPGVLKTVNFKHVKDNLKELEKMQPNAPLMVMEYWTGWFDWWGGEHHTMTVQDFGSTLKEIFEANASVNFYMFFGGTNFGFMNGGLMDEGNVYQSDITSYDYDALVAENGDLTPKYFTAKQIISQYFPDYVPQPGVYTFSSKVKRVAYGDLTVEGSVSFWNTLDLVERIQLQHPMCMEMLDINQKAGQSYGYILYSATVQLSGKTSYKLDNLENAYDRGIIFVDGERLQRFDFEDKNLSVMLPVRAGEKSLKLAILIENGGRINWQEFNNQRKGLVGPVTINNVPVTDWVVSPLEMNSTFIKKLQLSSKWSTASLSSPSQLIAPTFFKASLNIESIPSDTYLDLTNWGKGDVFVNGRNLGRYWSIGPQKALFLPAPWLKQGYNSIILFEENVGATTVKFCKEPKNG